MTGLSRASLALRDPEQAERALAAYFPSLRLGTRGARDVPLVDPTTTASQFSLVDYGFASPGSATAGSDDLVVIASAGQGYVIAKGRTAIDTTQSFLSPDEGLVARWDTLDARVLMLGAASVERVAQAASGVDDFRLVRNRDRSRLARARAVLAGRRAGPSTHGRGRTRRVRVRARRGGRLPSPGDGIPARVPTSWIDLPESGRAAAVASAVVRRATEFMRAHAGQPITMQQVAESAFVSTRGLHHAFVHELGEPPGASCAGCGSRAPEPTCSPPTARSRRGRRATVGLRARLAVRAGVPPRVRRAAESLRR